MAQFHLPDLGEGLQEAEVKAWHVAVGDHVVADQPLVSVETDKAVVEVPSPRAGLIAALHAEVGEMVPVGGPLVTFADAAAADAGTVVGTIEQSPAAPRPTPAAAPPRDAASPVKATPRVRALAREQGVDLATVRGTGPDGAVTATDVARAVPTPPPGDGAEGPAGAVQPLRGVRRAMAAAMARAHAQVVPATLTDEADVDAWPADADVTVRLIRALAAACRAEPALNVWYDGVAETRRLHDTVDLAIAMDTDDGLFAPVLRRVHARDAADLRRGLEAMRRDVRARTVPRAELRGATITLSNFGTLGGRHAALVVVPPQVAIIGAGRIEPRVVARDGRPAVRRLLPLSLTFDHRAVTGGEAARFLAALEAALRQES